LAKGAGAEGVRNASTEHRPENGDINKNGKEKSNEKCWKLNSETEQFLSTLLFISIFYKVIFLP
jgi:hypothetical protein